MQDVVDPVTDEMLARFVVDSHFKSQAKGANMDNMPLSNSEEDTSDSPMDPEVYTSYLPSLSTCTFLVCLELSFFLFESHRVFCLNFQILSQDMLKKYLTYAKLNVFPRLHDADLEKLTLVYAELRRESSVSFSSCLFI